MRLLASMQSKIAAPFAIIGFLIANLGLYEQSFAKTGEEIAISAEQAPPGTYMKPVTFDCVVAAAKSQHVNETDLWLILNKAHGKVGTIYKISDTVFAIGPTMIRKTWVPYLMDQWKTASIESTISELRYDGCANINAAATILRFILGQSNGDRGNALIAYFKDEFSEPDTVLPDQYFQKQVEESCFELSLSRKSCLSIFSHMQNPPTSQGIKRNKKGRIEVKLIKSAGIFQVPVTINGVIPLNFIIDSGASDIAIPADVFLTLIRTGTLQPKDFLGTQSYKLADGTIVPSQTFLIETLTVGDKTIQNVIASVSAPSGDLLLGQTFLSRFKSWSIDNNRQVLILN
jgi:predicted aspartyl protease